MFGIKETKAVGYTNTISDGIYVIKSVIDKNYALDIDNASKENYANVQAYKYNGSNAQKFKIKYLNI